MTDRAPDPRGDFRPIRPETSGIFGGALLLVAVVGLVYIGRWCLAQRRAQALRAVPAYVDPQSVDAGAPIRLGPATVGRIDTVGLALWVLRVGVVDSSESTVDDLVTLSPGESTTLQAEGRELVTVSSVVAGRAIVKGAGAWIELVRRPDRLWRATLIPASCPDCGPEGPKPPQLNGVPWKQGRACAVGDSARCLAEGDRFLLAGLRLTWLGEGWRSRAVALIDTTKLRATAERFIGVPEAGRLRRGIVLATTGALGVGRRGVRLVLPGREPTLVRDTVLELIPADGLNLDGVKGMLAYLTSPSQQRTPPANRWERMVDDLNGSAEQINAATAQAHAVLGRINGVSTAHGGQGMLARLTLDPDAQDRLRAILDTVPSLLAEVEALARTSRFTIDTTGRSIRKLADGVDGTVKDLEPSVDSLLGTVTAVAESLKYLAGDTRNALKSGKKGAKTVGIALIVALLASSLLDISELVGIR